MAINYRESWRHVRWMDAIPLLKAIYRGQNSSAFGTGAIGDFEKSFASLCGTAYALAMNSGTAALHSALFAVGVGPGDEVILPSYTWHATASAVWCCGATPVFCDINLNTLTMDPKDVATKITSKTKALIPVHVWGNPCEMDKILEIAQKNKLKVVEDCSHAHGASYKGKPVGSWGDIGCFSLQGNKAVSGGEAGIAVCSDPVYFDRMLALGHPVRTGRDMKTDVMKNVESMHLGPKYRPHLYSIFLAQASLKRLSELNRLRSENWKLLCEKLSEQDFLRPMATLTGAVMGGFLEYKLILNADASRLKRDDFLKTAQKQGIPISEDRYGFLHEKTIFGTLKGDLPNTQFLRERIVTLPAFTKVSRNFIAECASFMIGIVKNQ